MIKRCSLAWLPGVAAICGAMLQGTAHAQAAFVDATDAGLRSDVQLLADEGVISLPTMAWPIPVADLLVGVSRVDVSTIAEPGLQAAFFRVNRRVARSDADGDWKVRELRLSAGRPDVLRSYGTLARDEFELQSTGGVTTDRWSLTISATGVGSPEDGRHLRLDGSNLSIAWGNWLFSANQQERWWGPGWDGSLILSTNARPMPGVSLDRMRSTPFDFPLLRWLGPWRFSAFLGRAEKYRPDVDESLFMAMRLSFKPAQVVEFGLSRSAQFCGRGRPCDLTAFRNVLLGNDNAGLRVSAEDEPGNQMAGFDVRLTSPISALPLALYGQFIGEDNSSSGIPERYLGLLGMETWTLLDGGGTLRLHFEYANTNCKFAHPARRPNCAYRQGIFLAGYRYHGRSIGHTTDGDSESYAAGAEYALASGSRFGVMLRRAALDRRGGVDPYNTLTRGPGKHDSAEFSWRGRLLDQDVGASVGYAHQRLGDAAAAQGRAYGFIEWRRAL